MNPHQQNKVDISSLSPDEQRLFRLYGKLPTKKDLLQNKLKERKYFDSGDYALSKAGKASDIGVTQIGRGHPVPEKIPHGGLQHSPGLHAHTHAGAGNGGTGGAGTTGSSLPPPGHSHLPGSSPVKEASFLHRETSVEQLEEEDQRRDSQSQNRQKDDQPIALEK